MNIGFIGLGNMGMAIARNLIQAGHRLVVYNRSKDKAEALCREGADRALVADSPAAAARDAEVVITMLADDPAVEGAVLGAVHGTGGLVGALPPGAVHVSMSTISVELSERLQAAHGQRGQAYVAAPVFGRPDAAAAAKLWVVAAGPADAIARCQPLFDAIGQGTRVVGEQASLANLVKLSGNFLIISMIEALGEIFALARKAGLPPAELQGVLQLLIGGAPIFSRYAGMIAEGNYEPAGFRLRLGLKDVRLVLQAAEAHAVPLPLGSLVRDNLLAAISHGHGDADWSALALASAERAGLTTREG